MGKHIPEPVSMSGDDGMIDLLWKRWGFAIYTDPNTVTVFNTSPESADVVTLDWPGESTEFLATITARSNL